MPKGELFINGKDAFSTWKVSMDTKGLSALMTPASAKSYVEDESPLEDGTRIVDDRQNGEVCINARDINLTMHIKGKSKDEFFNNYLSFCQELKKGYLEIKTKYQPDITYKCWYANCSQFTEYNGELAMFTLKLREPNPTDRK